MKSLASLKEFLRMYPVMGDRQMRRIISKAKENGADVFVYRIGRKIFIDLDKFLQWCQRDLKK